MMVGWFCSCWLPWSWPSSEPEVTWFGQLRIFSPKPQRKRCSPPRWLAQPGNSSIPGLTEFSGRPVYHSYWCWFWPGPSAGQYITIARLPSNSSMFSVAPCNSIPRIPKWDRRLGKRKLSRRDERG